LAKNEYENEKKRQIERIVNEHEKKLELIVSQLESGK
jgi:hypothetical protein